MLLTIVHSQINITVLLWKQINARESMRCFSMINLDFNTNCSY